MIKEIIMKGIKGQETTQTLTGMDIFTGANGKGKTTRLQSLGISLLGYVQGQGKRAEDTFKWASKNQMTVGLKTDSFDFERTFEKEIKKKRDGSTEEKITQKITVSPSQGERTIKEKELRIQEEMGNFPVMLDFNEFLSLSDCKRREFIYNLAGFNADNWTKEKIETYLKENLLTETLRENDQDHYDYMAEIIKEAMKEYKEDLEIQEGLLSMVEWTKAELCKWKKEKANAEGASKKMAEMKNKLEHTDRNLKKNKEELEHFQNSLIVIEKQITENEAKRKKNERKAKDIEIIKAEIESIKKSLDTDKTVELKAQLEVIKAEKRDVLPLDNVKVHDDKIQALEGQIKRIEDEEIKALESTIKEIEDNKIKKLQDQIKDIQKNQQELCTKGAEAKAEKKGIMDTIEIIEKQAGHCVIDQKIACNKDFSKYIEHAKQKVKLLDEQMNICRESYKNDKAKIEDLEGNIQEGKEIITGIKAEIEEKRNEIKKIRTTIKAEEDCKRAIYMKNENIQKHNEEVDRRIKNIEKQIQFVDTSKRLTEQKIADKEEELTKLENMEDEIIEDMELIEKQKEALKKQIEELKEKIEGQQEAKLTLSQLQSTIIDSKLAEYKVLCYTSLNEAIGAKGLQGELIKETLEPIERNINDNLYDMSIENRFYFRTETEKGKPIFRFGWEDHKGNKRNFDSLSTGEQLILLIAILTTFIEKNSPKEKVLAIDNIENLDKKNFEKVVKGLGKIKGKLDNIILAGVISIDAEEYEGFRVWNLA